MAIRIVGVDLPQNKRGEIALTYIFGIGRSSSAKILDKAGVDRNIKVKDWTDDQAAAIREVIGADYKVDQHWAITGRMNVGLPKLFDKSFNVMPYSLRNVFLNLGVSYRINR